MRLVAFIFANAAPILNEMYGSIQTASIQIGNSALVTTILLFFRETFKFHLAEDAP
jgi:hypothetical protein